MYGTASLTIYERIITFHQTSLDNERVRESFFIISHHLILEPMFYLIMPEKNSFIEDYASYLECNAWIFFGLLFNMIQ